MSRTEIKYGTGYPFTGQPTPFIARDKTNLIVGERWGAEEGWTLIGQLTGCSFDSLITAQLNLINSFGRDYQDLELLESGVVIDRKRYVEINSIRFNSSKYVKVLPYTIELSCYPSGYFSGVYGILEPVDKWDLIENKNKTLGYTHTVSARGFNTSGVSNAYDNAKNYVLSRTGFANFPTPEFIELYETSGTLISQVESPNRLEGSYSITQTYTLDKFNFCDSGVLRYTVESNSPQAGLSTASINGTLQGGLNDNFSGLRSRINSFDFYSNLLYSLDSGIMLNPTPREKQIVENESAKTITFSYSYDDNKNYDTNYDYAVVINSGEKNISVSLNGTVNAGGELKNRWELAKNKFETVLRPNIYNLALSGYSGYLAEYGRTGLLNPTALNSSVSYDKYNGVVGFTYGFSDQPFPTSSGLESLDLSLSWTPPLRKIVAEEIIYQTGSIYAPSYEVTDLGYIPRGQFSINGNAVPKRELGLVDTVAIQSQVKNSIRAAFDTYLTGESGVYYTAESLGFNNRGDYSFGSSWTYEAADALGNNSNYSQIINL